MSFGSMGSILGGALLGVLMSKGSSGSQDMSYLNNSSQLAYQNAVATVPTAPEAPTTDNGQKSAEVLAAEEEERKKRLAEQEANKTNHTSGLGVTGAANVQRKTLLGAA